MDCTKFNPDILFDNFYIKKFPTTYVGMRSSLYINLSWDLEYEIYYKTICFKKIMNFEEAFLISARHKLFTVNIENKKMLKVTFHPTEENVFNYKPNPNYPNGVFIDLRLFYAVGNLNFCESESNTEIARYYFCAQYEFCNIHISPSRVNIERMPILSDKIYKCYEVENRSMVLDARLEYQKVPGFVVKPDKFIIKRNSSTEISVIVRPVALKLPTFFKFFIKPVISDEYEETNKLELKTKIIGEVFYGKKPNHKDIESLHKLINIDYRSYALTPSEANVKSKKKAEITEFRRLRLRSVRGNEIKEVIYGEFECCDKISKDLFYETSFKCGKEALNVYKLKYLKFIPEKIEFGLVAISSTVTKSIEFVNNSDSDVRIDFSNCTDITFSEKKLMNYYVVVRANSSKCIIVNFNAREIGEFRNLIEIKINYAFLFKIPYSVHVEEASLKLDSTFCSFGMIKSESFTVYQTINIRNRFNIPINYNWTFSPPFIIYDVSGSIPAHSNRRCLIEYPESNYYPKPQIIFFQNNDNTLEVTLDIVLKKAPIKRSDYMVDFNDIPLNIVTKRTIYLINLSKMLCFYELLGNLPPGVYVYPIKGRLRQKTRTAITISIQVPYILKIVFPVVLKINNKFTLSFPISGNVSAPKLQYIPKSLKILPIQCGLVHSVPVTIQNIGECEVLLEKVPIEFPRIDIYVKKDNALFMLEYFNEAILSPKEYITLILKFCDERIKDYETYLPIKINGILYPPSDVNLSIIFTKELSLYDGFNKKEKSQISYADRSHNFCKLSGCFVKKRLNIQPQSFNMIKYLGENSQCKEFVTIKNVYEDDIVITLILERLYPMFTIEFDICQNITYDEHKCYFLIKPFHTVKFCVEFVATELGDYMALAPFYLNQVQSVSYDNFLFFGRVVESRLLISTSILVFPITRIGYVKRKIITLSGINIYKPEIINYFIEDDECEIKVIFLNGNTINNDQDQIEIEIIIFSEIYCENIGSVTFSISSQNEIVLKLLYCFCSCDLTLHSNAVLGDSNTYPFYPTENDVEAFAYMERTVQFLEKWLYSQGFRKKMYPEIPETFYTSSFLYVCDSEKSAKITTYFLTFFRRMCGCSILKKQRVKNKGQRRSDNGSQCDIPINLVNAYEEQIRLISARGAILGLLRPEYLLEYDDFVALIKDGQFLTGIDENFNIELCQNREKYLRLSKQMWIDMILQSYKVFVVNNRIFNCFCLENKGCQIDTFLVEWLNNNMEHRYKDKNCKLPPKVISLTDNGQKLCTAFAAATVNFCPYMIDYFKDFIKIEHNSVQDLVHNTLLLYTAWKVLKIDFPLSGRDLLSPVYLQILFLSIHLQVVLPLLTPKDTFYFKPPLSGASRRDIIVFPASDDYINYDYFLLENDNNVFSVTKHESKKKNTLSVIFTAKYISPQKTVLIAYGDNRKMIFMSYVVFELVGSASAVKPFKKIVLHNVINTYNKVGIQVKSPYDEGGQYNVSLIEREPTLQGIIEMPFPRFVYRRIGLLTNEMYIGVDEDANAPKSSNRLTLRIACICMNSMTFYIWFSGTIGSFFLKVVSNVRSAPLETLFAKIPIMDYKCSCGAECECYRTGEVAIPNWNRPQLQTLRQSIESFGSGKMMKVYDILMKTTYGREILVDLLLENGTDANEITHIFDNNVLYELTSRDLVLHDTHVCLNLNSSATSLLYVTLPPESDVDVSTKGPVEHKEIKKTVRNIVLRSTDGTDVRSYNIVFETYYNLFE